ncbi:MAG: outer membrane lipoprotein carrier protein LolA [Halioglobus sp.]
MHAWRYCLLLCALCSVSVAAADDTVTGDAVAAQVHSAASVTARLANRNILHGLFEQTRELQGVSGGLTSTGEFYFWRGHGIYLSTLEPIVQATTYRSDTTLRWAPGEPKPQVLNGRRDRHFRDLLMSIFDFDTEQLERDFQQAWRFEDQEWELQLTPRSFASKRFLESITLRGSQHIDALTIVSKSGEKLRILFSSTQTLAALAPQICVERFAYSAEQCGNSADHGQK